VSVTAEPRPSLVTLTHVIYGLHAASLLVGILTAASVVGAFLTGWPSIIAVILNYVKRAEARGTWLASHFRWQIRTFWFGFLWVALCLVFIFLTLGIGLLVVWIPLGFVGLWFIYRIARGWLALVDHRAIAAILLVALTLAASTLPASAADELACNQQPGDRFFWVERAFCDVKAAGPDRAQGLIIWNHGIQGTSESWKAPAAPVMRLLQIRGWDVMMIKRHHLAETMPGGPLERTVKRTLDEVAAAKRAGYKRIALAGQSFGGYVTLEAIDSSPDIDAAIAFSPGIRASGATGALDPTIIERILQRARVGRLALVFPKDDVLFGSIARGERARPILSRRDLPWLMIDERASEITGHGGGVTGRFAVRYGNCLSDFLSAASLARGPFACPPATEDARVVRELLLPPGPTSPTFVTNAEHVAAELRTLLGPRWGMLGDNVVQIGRAHV